MRWREQREFRKVKEDLRKNALFWNMLNNGIRAEQLQQEYDREDVWDEG